MEAFALCIVYIACQNLKMRILACNKREVKTPPNYPPHPPMPASRYPKQVLHIPADYQLPEHSGTVGNWEWSVSRILPDYSQFGGCSRYSG